MYSKIIYIQKSTVYQLTRAQPQAEKRRGQGFRTLGQVLQTQQNKSYKLNKTLSTICQPAL